MNVEILIQGPVYENTNFIYKNYKQSGYEVTVSTYSNTDEHLLKLFDSKDVVLSDLPTNMGIYNRNGQRITTNKGLINIKHKYNNSFVLKTRSDHFFKNIKDTITKFIEEIYQHDINISDQKYRMIIPNAGTTLTEVWGKFHISDHWMFGNIDNVLNYYTLDNVDTTKDFQISENNSPESEFCMIWLKNNKIIGNFDEILGKRFVVLDNEDLNYVITKNCYPMNCETSWKDWNSKDNGVVYNNKWIKLKQEFSL